MVPKAFILSLMVLGFAASPSLVSAQSNLDLPVYQVTESPADITPMGMQQQACAINNLQGGLASGTLGIFAVAEQGFATLFDPTGSGDPGDPGCFVGEPYPFQINNVQLNIAAAGLFGLPAAEGVGTFEYVIKIWSADEDAEGCNAPAEVLFTSSVQTVEITEAANTFPQTIDIDFEVEDKFFVLVESVSWSGAADRSPSAVLWGNVPLVECRQYVLLFNNDGDLVAPDMVDIYDTPGWTNVIVNGETADQEGDVDVAVSDVTADPELVQSLPATVTATVSNLGEVAVAGVEVVLSANGSTVFTTSVNVAPGASTGVEFIYTPATLGEVELTVSTDEEGDIDVENNSASTTVTVIPPADPCIFSDDIESYELGGLVSQSDQWVTWTPGAANQDAEVTDEQANSGTQSVKIGAAPEDVNFLLGNQTSGTWNIGFFVYVPQGNGAYWNIQKSQTEGVEWAVQMLLNNDGSGSIDAGGVDAATFDYTQDAWNEVEIVVNLDSDVANLYFAGEFIYQWTYSWSATTQDAGLVQIGSINFFPEAADNPLMYVDDLSFCQYYNNTACEAFELVADQVVVGDNTDATPWDGSLAEDATCWAEGTNTVDNDVWYTFTVPADGSYLVSTNLEVLTNDDTQLLVYTSSDDSCEGELTAIGCGEDIDNANYLSEAILEDLTEGTVIYIMVDGWQGAAGTFQIGVFSLAVAENDMCVDAVDLSNLVGGELDMEMNSETYANTLATGGDVELPSCFEDGSLDLSLWYSFEGDGNTYFITTNDCGGDINYVPFGDTQLAIYTGDCDGLTEVACNEDLDFDADIYEAGVEFPTEAGVTYYVIVDTWDGGTGEYCVSFTNLGQPDNTDISDANAAWNVFPNPASNMVRIQADHNMEHIMILSSSGQLVKRLNATHATELTFDVSGLAKGLYFVQMTIDGQISTKKLTVQ